MKKLLFISLLISNIIFAVPTVYFVDASKTLGENTGVDWDNAYLSIQSALAVALSGDQIWVAKGTYKPTDGADPSISFVLNEGVELYGGFAGGELSIDDRANYGAGQVNATTLSGNLGGSNSYHIITATGPGWTVAAVLNGFIITGGNDNAYFGKGSGMLNISALISLANCTFTDNSSSFDGTRYQGGTGAALHNESSTVDIINCIFSNNFTAYGGAIYNLSSNIVITDCNFYDNTAYDGGALYNNASSQTMTNCIIRNNSAQRGGAMFCNDVSASSQFINCTFNGNNVSDVGGAVFFNFNTNNTITNSILWGDYCTGSGIEPEIHQVAGTTTPNITYSCIQGGFAGTGNISTDPLFVDAAGHDLRIMGVSPCADAGLDAVNSESYDIRGTGYSRKLNKADGTAGTIDIGAYEYKFSDDPMPVELTSFTANTIDKGIELKWNTATEINNYGFEIERASLGTSPCQDVWIKIGFVTGSGNSNSPKEYSFIDANPGKGNLQYRLKQIDLDGNYKYYSTIIKINYSITGVKEKQLPVEYTLEQNYPNPFNPTTVINYALPVAGMVKLEVFNSLGEKIATLVNEVKNAGNYQVGWNADGMPSGIYFYTIHAKEESGLKEFRMVKKMMIIK